MDNKEEKKPRNGGIQNFFYGPIGQYIEHVEQINFGMDKDGNFRFGDAKGEDVQKKLFPDLPTKEEMCKAIAETVTRGLWWSSRSWAVVFRVYQMKGYMSGFTQFVREVNTWPVETGYKCNYDALQKPITSGVLSGNPDGWAANGAQQQAVKLAHALLDLLDKNNR